MNVSKMGIAQLADTIEVSALLRLFNEVEHSALEQVQANPIQQDYYTEAQLGVA